MMESCVVAGAFKMYFQLCSMLWSWVIATNMLLVIVIKVFQGAIIGFFAASFFFLFLFFFFRFSVFLPFYFVSIYPVQAVGID